MPGKIILFVCTGNLCRSPMAEYLLRHRLGPGREWAVKSAGTAGLDGMTATLAAIDAVAQLGIDMRDHRSSPLTREGVEEASVIVVMTRGHQEEIRNRFPEVMDRVFLMKSFGDGMGGKDIVDPIGMSSDIYVIVRDEIDICIPGLIKHLAEADGIAGRKG